MDDDAIAHMIASDSNGETRVELCVRSLLPRGARSRQDAVVRRLNRLETAGIVDDASVVVWGRGIVPDRETARTDAWQAIRNRVEAFLAWAENADGPLEPFADRRHHHSWITGEEFDAIRFPRMTLAVYRDDALVYVAPNDDGATDRSVVDVLDALEHGEDLLRDSPAMPFRPRSGVPTTSDGRP